MGRKKDIYSAASIPFTLGHSFTMLPYLPMATAFMQPLIVNDCFPISLPDQCGGTGSPQLLLGASAVPGWLPQSFSKVFQSSFECSVCFLIGLLTDLSDHFLMGGSYSYLPKTPHDPHESAYFQKSASQKLHQQPITVNQRSNNNQQGRTIARTS